MSSQKLPVPTPEENATKARYEAKLCVEKGDERASDNRHESAIRYYSKAIKLSPSYALAYSGRGASRLNQASTQNELHAAVSDLTHAIDIPRKQGLTEDVTVIYNRALAYQRIAIIEQKAGHEELSTLNFLSAEKDFTAALKIQPSSDAYQGRGTCMLALKKEENAAKDFTRALKSDSNTSRLNYRKLEQYKQLGDRMEDTTQGKSDFTTQLQEAYKARAMKRKADDTPIDSLLQAALLQHPTYVQRLERMAAANELNTGNQRG